MKYLVPCALFLPANEILSITALIIIVLMFLWDIVEARQKL